MQGVDRESILIGTTWERTRQFRIALTAGEDQLKRGGYHHLFDGYDEQVVGTLRERMADVMPMSDVRSYLNNLASLVSERIKEMAAAYV